MIRTPKDRVPMASRPLSGDSSPGPIHGGKGNRNAIRHGLFAGVLPDKCKHVEMQVNKLRRQIEDSVLKLRGEITLVDAAHIQTAIKFERHGALALTYLRRKGDELKPMELLQFSREIAMASRERDKALAALRLDEKPPPLDLQGYLTHRRNGNGSEGSNSNDSEHHTGD